MPFRTALSGLNAASTELRVIGNNVANASTTGFKKSRVEFADIFASSGLGAASNAIGSGVRVGNISQQFSTGNIGFTENNLDLAISGQGFFRLDDGGVNVYTRAGQFGVDKNGLVVNSADQVLTGFLADTNGNITGALGNIQLDTSDLPPQATTTVIPGINLNASASIPSTPAVTSTIRVGSAGGAPILDTLDSPITTAAFPMTDSYGNAIPGVQLQFTDLGGGLWNADLLGAGGTMTTASFTPGTSGSVSLSWDSDGALGAQLPTSINIDVSTITQATVGGTSDISLTANGGSVDGRVQGVFDVADASTFNNSTSLTVYDSQGIEHLATMYYRQTGVPNQWESYTYYDGVQVAGSQTNGSDLLQFNTNGGLDSINGASIGTSGASVTTPIFSPGGSATPQTLTFDLSGLTQFGGGFNVTALNQDGFSTGRLSGIDIDDGGVILARFTNGQTKTMAQVALANFTNPQGLSQQGASSWAESFSSGAALVGGPGTGSLGLIQSGALEGSNVDLTEQLVSMITAQRNFQANAQVITTADTITQTIINIR